MGTGNSTLAHAVLQDLLNTYEGYDVMTPHGRKGYIVSARMSMGKPCLDIRYYLDDDGTSHAYRPDDLVRVRRS